MNSDVSDIWFLVNVTTSHTILFSMKTFRSTSIHQHYFHISKFQNTKKKKKKTAFSFWQQITEFNGQTIFTTISAAPISMYFICSNQYPSGNNGQCRYNIRIHFGSCEYVWVGKWHGMKQLWKNWTQSINVIKMITKYQTIYIYSKNESE